MKKCIGCCLSHQNPDTYFSPDSEQNTFSLEEALLWIQFWVKTVLMLDVFQVLSSPDDNWWTRVLWWLRLSFWRHPFTAEHPLTLILTAPIHCRASIAETHFSKPDEETHSYTSRMVSTFPANVHFWVNYKMEELKADKVQLRKNLTYIESIIMTINNDGGMEKSSNSQIP